MITPGKLTEVESEERVLINIDAAVRIMFDGHQGLPKHEEIILVPAVQQLLPSGMMLMGSRIGRICQLVRPHLEKHAADQIVGFPMPHDSRLYYFMLWSFCFIHFKVCVHVPKLPLTELKKHPELFGPVVNPD